MHSLIISLLTISGGHSSGRHHLSSAYNSTPISSFSSSIFIPHFLKAFHAHNIPDIISPSTNTNHHIFLNSINHPLTTISVRFCLTRRSRACTVGLFTSASFCLDFLLFLYLDFTTGSEWKRSLSGLNSRFLFHVAFFFHSYSHYFPSALISTFL